MNVRNVRQSPEGFIEFEAEHPVFGWIPSAASPDDPDPRGQEVYQFVLSLVGQR